MWIKNRIDSEYKKHKKLDWSKIAEQKILSNILELIKTDLEIANSIRKELLKNHPSHYEDSDYNEWNNEVDGIEYHIRKLEELKRLLSEGERT